MFARRGADCAGVATLFKGAGANILRGVAGAGVLSLYDKLQEVLFGKGASQPWREESADSPSLLGRLGLDLFNATSRSATSVPVCRASKARQCTIVLCPIGVSCGCVSSCLLRTSLPAPCLTTRLSGSRTVPGSVFSR